ncbi:hypothetical protein FACS1894132_12500 [Clostridia bacterium]|nr:hypothetical protein FACS1894132_12500 [Clostridia bacterium]
MVYDVEEIKELLTPVFVQYGTKSAVLFGSYARGTANEKSDVDILVDSGLIGLNFFGLVDYIQQTLNKEVDVFDIKEVKRESKVAVEIKNTGIKIYG